MTITFWNVHIDDTIVILFKCFAIYTWRIGKDKDAVSLCIPLVLIYIAMFIVEAPSKNNYTYLIVIDFIFLFESKGYFLFTFWNNL